MIQLEPVDYLETLIQQALPRWNITPEASLKLLSYSENATFLCQMKNKNGYFE